MTLIEAMAAMMLVSVMGSAAITGTSEAETKVKYCLVCTEIETDMSQDHVQEVEIKKQTSEPTGADK